MRKCEYCGEYFEPKKNERFCTPICGVRASSEQKPVDNCIICGNEFHRIYKNQVTCGSEKCKKARSNSTKTEKRRKYKYEYNKNEGIKPVKKAKKRKPTAKEWGIMTPCQRWEYMSLTEISAELARLHLSYGQAQVLKDRRELPLDFGEGFRK